MKLFSLVGVCIFERIFHNRSGKEEVSMMWISDEIYTHGLDLTQLSAVLLHQVEQKLMFSSLRV